MGASAGKAEAMSEDGVRAEGALHIVQLCTSSTFNGEAAHVYSLARSLQARGHVVTLAYRRRKAGRLLELHPRLIEQYGIHSSLPLDLDKGFSPLTNPRGLFQLAAFVKRHPVRVVHSHRGLDHSAAGILSRLLGVWKSRPVRLVRTRHVTTPIRGHRANRWLYERADLLLATAKCIQEEFHRKLPGLRTPVCLFHGGVDVERFSPDHPPADLRAQQGIAPEAIIVGCVGHLDPVKGYDGAIAALAKLSREGTDLHLVIAGAAGAWNPETLQALAEKQGVGSRVHLLGFRRDIPALLAAFDIGLIPSVGSEGNSRTALEMMAGGLPVVAGAVGCLPDLIEPGANGLLAPAGDVEALCRCIRRLAQEPDLRRKMGRAGRRRAETLYDERQVAARLEIWYRGLLRGCGGPRE